MDPTSLEFQNYARAIKVLELPGAVLSTTAYVLKYRFQ